MKGFGFYQMWLYASVERMEWLLILHLVGVILQVDWEACAESCSQSLCLVLLLSAAPHNESRKVFSLSLLSHSVRRTSINYSFRVLKKTKHRCQDAGCLEQSCPLLGRLLECILLFNLITYRSVRVFRILMDQFGQVTCAHRSDVFF